MANMNIRTPKFFPDLISYHRARGSAIGAVTATGGSGTTATRGLLTGTAAELFDLRPLNLVDFDTSGATESQVLVTIGFSTASYKQNFIAILNHNLATAVGKIRVFAGDTSTEADDVDASGASTGDINWSSVTVTEVVNADDITVGSGNTSIVIEPGTDGTTIITFTEQDLRYWAVQFEGNTTNTGNATNGTWGSTNLSVGGIMIGEAYSMPHSSDLSVKRSIIYDAVKIQESVGGQRFANATSFGRTASTASKSPFALGTNPQTTHGGRLAYDMNFSFLNSTDVMPDEYATLDFDDDAVVEDVWNMVDGPHRPFIFTVDDASLGSNAESEYIFARFGQSSLDMTQVANDIWNISMRIEEEF
jgi:hypothetical protein